MDINNCKMDKEEFVKQHNEKIRNSDNYMEVTMLVEKGNGIVIPYVKVHNVGTVEVACMLKTLKAICDEIEERYPEAAFLAKFGMDSKNERL